MLDVSKQKGPGDCQVTFQTLHLRTTGIYEEFSETYS